MPKNWKDAGGPGRGMFPEMSGPFIMQNRTSAALLQGQVVQVDERNESTTATSFLAGGDLSALSGVHEAQTAALGDGTFLVYEGPASLAVGAWGKFWLKHPDILCSINGALATAVTDVLTVANNQVTLDQNPAASTTLTRKIIAKVVVAQTAGVHTAATVLTRCRFDGEGFGFMAQAAG